MSWRERPAVKYFLAEIPVLGDLIFSTKAWEVAIHDAIKCVAGFGGMMYANKKMMPAETEMSPRKIAQDTLWMALALTVAKVSFNTVREVCKCCCCSSCKREQRPVLHHYESVRTGQSANDIASSTNVPDTSDAHDLPDELQTIQIPKIPATTTPSSAVAQQPSL